MEIGKEVSFVHGNKLKTETIAWKTEEHAYFKKDDGTFHLVELQHLIVSEDEENQEKKSSEEDN